ncbi:DUF1682-domain-containing protein [Hesseltinella vesiculosa]|uniref:DUF1682-domain-containing protein n=1 Tax=Hesseltinella vesiculosa TaxID=101127 RepID=A0A1X2GT81_9FUNG|nr:DUF1682-domain-containing protein [Hesseltinella vesiculosa]
MIMTVMFCAYIMIYKMGAGANQKVATQWANVYNDYLAGQFALVGNREGSRTTIFKDGPSDYFLYTSGRMHVQFAHWCLKLKPRCDPVTYLTSFLFSLIGWADPVKDRANISVTLDSNIKNRFVFAILDKSIAKDKYKKRFDLSKLTKLATVDLPTNLEVYTESQKLAEMVVAGQVSDILRRSSGLEMALVTYLPDFEPENLKLDGDLTVQVVYDVENPESASLFELPLALADAVAKLHMPVDVQNKLKKNIDGVAKAYAKRDAEDRAEQLAKKKAEAKRAEADRVKNLSSSEQRKFDEKERQREKKKELKKRTKRA